VGEKLTTITFHGIGDIVRPLDDGEAEVWLGREEFARALDAVAGRKHVRITFDDGNASDLAYALPELQRRGLSATFFVVAGRLDEPGFLDGEGVRALAAAGMAIGCHGMRHVPWRTVSDHELHNELVEARRTLEAVVEQPVVEAACPFGSYDRRVLTALRHSGYRRVYTSDRGASRASAWLQPRNTVRRGEGSRVLEHALHPASPQARLRRRARLTAKRWR
jgi:peptidoglycan/xylan/chitin deacetylase (PgdA/CDA1 family)